MKINVAGGYVLQNSESKISDSESNGGEITFSECYILQCFELKYSLPHSILGDPGAASRVDGIFMGESLQQERESPWALTERVPEPFEIQKNIFPANQKAGFQTAKYQVICRAISQDNC